MRMRSYRPVVAIVVVAAVAMALGGCGGRVPSEDPSIRGDIVAVLPADGLGAIAVEAPKPPEFDYDRAVVTIDDKTTLLRQTTDGDTERIEYSDLALGQGVDVWFEGPVAESYPVQATAGMVLVRE